jgi:acyl carrier protein
MEHVKETVKAYLLKEFLPGENPEALTDTVPLITGGILDSLATLKLVAFLEEQFNFEMMPYETNVDYMNTLDDITKLVQSKLKA